MHTLWSYKRLERFGLWRAAISTVPSMFRRRKNCFKTKIWDISRLYHSMLITTTIGPGGLGAPPVLADGSEASQCFHLFLPQPTFFSGQTNFDPHFFSDKKKFNPIFFPANFWFTPIVFSDKKNLTQIFFGQKICWPKFFLAKKNFNPIFFANQIIVRSNFFQTPTNSIWTNFGGIWDLESGTWDSEFGIEDLGSGTWD